MGEVTLTKVAASLNRMHREQENRDALELFSSYDREDQVKIAQCFEFLKQSEEATKVAHEKGELDAKDVVAPMTPARRLKMAIELAHFNELASNEELAKQAEEAAAAGALMSNLFVDYVKEAMPPEMVAMKEKMQKAEDRDDDGKKLEGTKGEHENLPDTKEELKEKKEKKDDEED